MNSRTRNNLTGLLLLAPHLAGLSLFFLIPFLWVLGRSLNGSQGIGITNYLKLWSNEAFLLAVKNTIVLTGITVPVLLIVSLSVALLAKRYLRSGHYVLHTFVLNYAIPTASIAYIWSLLYGNHGWVNEGLSYLHLSSPINWLDGRALYIPIVSLFIFKYTAYPAIILYGGLSSLPPSIFEAASVDALRAFNGSAILRCRCSFPS
ncbi:sugar ABC transporter permease [Paenibacillus sp. PR3]|uniref:Sugar ABC transporter permease n=1 Tax=Paenibacillus terricola TaxID=2763503 RepID=A0ABR8MMI8_9BACL|nr:sugar ABC transporter permease [Paenibacillus terricola]MBD3917225.1 sugar ABC transporter permease [Paenibacillus terricola]